MILTKRRSADDVFLIGEESLLDREPDTQPDLAVTDPATAEPLASPAAASSPARSLGSLHGARGIALLGLGAAAAATLGVLELGGGGEAASVHREAPARSPLISRSAASAPTRVEVRRPSVVHHRHRPRHRRPRRHRRAVVIRPSEPAREPTQPVAPVSSPTEATPEAPAPAPPVVVAPAPPSPPPPSSGGGSGGTEQFGFEG